MKTTNTLPILLLFTSTLIAQRPKDPQKTIGPVTVIEAVFDYHNLIRFADGTEKEFYPCTWTGALKEGRKVYISFTGDGTSMELCAHDVSVKEAKK